MAHTTTNVVSRNFWVIPVKNNNGIIKAHTINSALNGVKILIGLKNKDNFIINLIKLKKSVGLIDDLPIRL